jgi:O-antigen/teichoic acid export membrane protein
VSAKERSSLGAFLREAVVLGVGRQASALVALAVVPILARTLHKEGLGLLDVVGRAVTLTTLVAGLGLDTANLVVFNQVPAGERRRLLGTSLAFRGLVTGAALALLAGLASSLAPVIGSPGPVPLQAAAGAGLALVLATQAGDLLRLARRQGAFASLGVVTSVVNLGGIALFVVALGWGVTGFFVADGLSNVVVLPVALFLGRDLVVGGFDGAGLKRLLGIGAPTVVASVADWGLRSVDRYALLAYGSLGDVGVLSIASQLAGALAILGGTFQAAWAPYALSIQDQEHARETYARVGRLLVLVIGAAALGLALFSREILAVFTTREFVAGDRMVACLVFAPLFVALYYLFSLGIYMSGATEALSYAVLAALAVHVGLVFLLVPRLGALGAAISLPISRLAQVATTFALARKRRPVDFDLVPMAVGILVLAASIVAGVLVLASDMGTPASIGLRFGIFVVGGLALVLVLARGEARALLGGGA